MSTASAHCNFYNQLGAPSPVNLSLLPNHWAVFTYASTMRYGSEEHSNLLDMPFPERTLVEVQLQGHKLALNPYHGRDTVEQEMDEFGFQYEGEPPQFHAALITPTLLTLVTYGTDGTWTQVEHPIKDGCLEYEGKFYGDFSIDVVTKV